MTVIGLSSVYTSAGIWGKPWGPPVSSVCGVYVYEVMGIAFILGWYGWQHMGVGAI